MAKHELSADEVADLATALDMRANYIETGHVNLTAGDFACMSWKKPPRPLDDGQKRKVLALRDLRDKLLAADSAAGVR